MPDLPNKASSYIAPFTRSIEELWRLRSIVLIRCAALITTTAYPALVASASDVSHVASTPSEVVSFSLAEERLSSGRFTLSNGTVVSRADWPALVFARFAEESCSGALVGPNVLLTSAHCVEDRQGRPRRAELSKHGVTYSMSCERHPSYTKRRVIQNSTEPRASEDYALCAIDYRGRMPKQIERMSVEVIDLSAALRRGGNVLLTGYGCIDTRIVGREIISTASADILRIGDARISRAPTPQWSDPAYVLIDSRDDSTPALCPGDSGGPMFSGASESAQTGSRRIIGVNSAIALGRTGRSDHIISKVAATTTKSFQSWARDWHKRNAPVAPVLCGVSHFAGNFPCRE
jgi:hypothetical protein